MRISRSVGALAILAVCGCVDAFHCGPSPPSLSSSSLLRDVVLPSRSSSSSSSPTSTMAIHERTMSAVVAAGRRSPRPVAAPSSSSLSRSTRSRLREGAPSREDAVRGSSSAGAASPTRREALRRFRDALLLSSTAAAVALAWDSGRDAAHASEFSDGPVLGQQQQQEQQQQQQLDKDGGSDSVATTILASDPSISADDGIIAFDDGASVVASSPSSSTAILAKSSSSEGEDGTPSAPMTPAQLKSSAVGAEVGLSAAAIFGMLIVVSGKSYPKNDDFSAVKARVVMIQPEPYGLEAGRRYYGGVYVRGDDPECDYGVRVRSSCETGVVDDGCASAISDFLDEMARGGAGTDDGEGGGGPSEGQRETANAVLTYLDSLSSPPPSSDAPSTTTTPPPPPASADGGPVSEAFSSYLDGLSRGEIDAPASPRLVADYLASLNEVRVRMIALESSVGRLPDEISGRLEHWQRERDGQLAREFVKIEEFLIKNRGADDGDGGGGGMDSVDMNGNVSVNGGYGSRALFS
jgi:hypothetical protein